MNSCEANRLSVHSKATLNTLNSDLRINSRNKSDSSINYLLNPYKSLKQLGKSIKYTFCIELMDKLEASSSDDTITGEQFINICKKCDIFKLKKLKTKQLPFDVINAKDANGLSGLAHLCMKGRPDCVKMIAEMENLQVNIGDNEGNTPLILATQSGLHTVVTFLVNHFKKKIDLEMRNDFGFTALMKAAILGRNKCLQVLLSAGANPNLRDSSKGFTAFQWAQYCGRTSTVEEMIKLSDDKRVICCKLSSNQMPIDDDTLISPSTASSSSMYALSTSSPTLSQIDAGNQSRLATLDRRKSLSVPQIIITQSSASSSSSSCEKEAAKNE